MFAIENYIKQCSQSQATVFGYLREIILSCSPDIKEEVYNNVPTYSLGKKVFSVSLENNDTVLSFSDSNPAFPQSLHISSAKEMDLVDLQTSINKVLQTNNN